MTLEDAKEELANAMKDEPTEKADAPMYAEPEVSIHANQEYLWDVNIKAVTATSENGWEKSPNGEITKLQAEPPQPTMIDPRYIKFECAACQHIFWAWQHQPTFNCPKCNFPLVHNHFPNA